MSEFKRAMDLEQGVIDLATGEFPVTLFTNGEAKDGHILGIRGGEIPESLPMFVNHDADPTKRAGQLITPAKFGDDRAIGDAAVKMIGRIDVQGDSAAADIRRDLAQGISVGDITAMSGRWDSVGEPTLRQNLDKSHYAYRETGMGFYFETWRALEGSIVGLGADASALIGRAQDLSKPEHVREFWRAMTEAPEEVVSGLLAAHAAAARQINHEAGSELYVPVITSRGEEWIAPEIAATMKATHEALDDAPEDEFTETEVSEERAESHGDSDEPEADPSSSIPPLRIEGDRVIAQREIPASADVLEIIRSECADMEAQIRQEISDGMDQLFADHLGRLRK